MRRAIRCVLVLGGLLVSGAIPSAIARADAPVESGYCFRCDDWEESHGWEVHRDYQLFFNEWEGNYMHWTEIGSCGSWHNGYGAVQ